VAVCLVFDPLLTMISYYLRQLNVVNIGGN